MFFSYAQVTFTTQHRVQHSDSDQQDDLAERYTYLFDDIKVEGKSYSWPLIENLNTEEREEIIRRYFEATKQAAHPLDSDHQFELVNQLTSFIDIENEGEDKDYSWTVSNFSQVLSEFHHVLTWRSIPARHRRYRDREEGDCPTIL